VTPQAIGGLPRRGVARTVAKVRARLRRKQLSRALAAGVEPWTSGPLMARAAELTSPSTRHKLAGSIDALIELAERGGSCRPGVPVARREVLAEREAFLALATRLRDPAPAGVAGLALLAELLRPRRGPLYECRARPGAVAEVVGRCLVLLEPTGVGASASAPYEHRRGGG
jgi:hypothetical protein